MHTIHIALDICCLALAAIPHTSTAQTVRGQGIHDAAQANKELVSRFYAEAWAAGDLSVADRLFAPGYILRNGSEPQRVGPPQSAIVRKAHRKIRGLAMSQELIVAENDLVAVRLTLEFVPAGITGLLRRAVGYAGPIEMPGTVFFRFQDGRVVEMWSTWDNLVRYDQGGVLRWLLIAGFAAGVVFASLALGFVYFSFLRE